VEDDFEDFRAILIHEMDTNVKQTSEADRELLVQSLLYLT